MDQRNFTFLFYGFAGAWLVLFVYVLILVQRTRKLRDRLNNAEASRDVRA
jgi:CcmD family protein